MSSPPCSPNMSDAADTPMSGSCGSPSPHSPLSTSSTNNKQNILDFSNKNRKDNSSNNSDSGDSTTSAGRMITRSPKNVVLETSLVDAERTSINSSPATLVPTPRSTPPVNGILTPPNDVEGNIEPTKLSKPGGRLKFFKDGVLCLELTHHGEGERTKWVQIRSKTVFPTLVHTKKEAIIPCHSTPSSFASPSSLSNNHRVESSTSHSLSDDACSMLSSPRAARGESHWKQPVPQRGVSACLEFFMKPAPCALKLRGKLKELNCSINSSSHLEDQTRKRWPYNFNHRRIATAAFDDVFLKLKNKNSVQCSCDDDNDKQSRVLTKQDEEDSSSRNTNKTISVNNNNNIDVEDDDKKSPNNEEKDPDKDQETSNDNNDKDTKKLDDEDDAMDEADGKTELSSSTSLLKSETSKRSSKTMNPPRKISLQKMVEHLEKLAELESQRKAAISSRDLSKSSSTTKANGDAKCSSSNSVKVPSITPKKRLFNEVDSSKETSIIRPKKKSPNNRAHHQQQHLSPYPNDLTAGSRTILNIPGLNSEFYKRQTPTKVSKSSGGGHASASPLHASYMAAATAAAELSEKYKSSKGEMSASSAKRISNRRSPNFGAKLVSPPGGGNVLKSELAGAEQRYSPSPSSLSGRNTSSPRHHNNSSSNFTASSLPLQEQKYFQQQTMSKAISYTINSLLGSNSMGANNAESMLLSSTPNSKRSLADYTAEKHLSATVAPAADPLSSHSSAYRGSSQSHRERGENSGKHNMSSSSIKNNSSAAGPQDQNSFLRHLLDTSDPIPQVKSSVDRSGKSSSLSRATPPTSHHNPHHTSAISNSTSSRSNNYGGGSSGAPERVSQKSSKSSASTGSSSNHYSNHHSVLSSSLTSNKSHSHSGSSSKTASASKNLPPAAAAAAKESSSLADVQQSIATNLALQSLMSQLPFGGVTSPYELLARANAANNQHSTEAITAAAAAAAALQYSSLLPPGHPFHQMNHANNTMAAMAAQFYGMMPPMANFPLPTSSPSPIIPSSISTARSSSNSSPAGSQPSPPPTTLSSYLKSNSSSNSLRKRQLMANELLQQQQQQLNLHQQQHSRGNSGSSSGGASGPSWQGLSNGGPHLYQHHGSSSSSSSSNNRKAATATANSHSSSPSPSAVRSRSSPSSAILSSGEIPSSYGALNLCAKKKSKVEATPTLPPADLDAPLDLCKKSSR